MDVAHHLTLVVDQELAEALEAAKAGDLHRAKELMKIVEKKLRAIADDLLTGS